jgi:hypothetical protein
VWIVAVHARVADGEVWCVEFELNAFGQLVMAHETEARLGIHQFDGGAGRIDCHLMAGGAVVSNRSVHDAAVLQKILMA